MTYEVKINKKVSKELARVPKQDRLRILERLRSLREDPHYGAEKLKGHDKFVRVRTGDYRIIFSVEGSEVYVLFVGHRKNVYDEFFGR